MCDSGCPGSPAGSDLSWAGSGHPPRRPDRHRPPHQGGRRPYGRRAPRRVAALVLALTAGYDVIGLERKDPLLCDPGSCWNYGLSTDVLGRVVEVASGQPLDAFFQSRVFEPLGMADTGFRVPEAKLDRVATLYQLGEQGLEALKGPFVRDPTASPGLLSGGGGLYSTAADYLRFLRMIARGGELDGVRLLEPGSVAEMTRNQLPDELVPIAVTDPVPGVGFGLGFSVRVAESEAATAGAVGDYGWDGLASTHAWVSPSHHLIVVTLEQTMPFATVMADAVRPPAYAAVAADPVATH